MKLTLSVVFVVAVQTLAVACPKGSTEYNGACYVDIQPEKDNTPSVKPLDEKPPKDRMPSYQREGIHADEPQSLIYKDAQEDQAKAQATIQGREAAGIK